MNKVTTTNLAMARHYGREYENLYRAARILVLDMENVAAQLVARSADADLRAFLKQRIDRDLTAVLDRVTEIRFAEGIR